MNARVYRLRKRAWMRHCVVGLFGALVAYLFWLSRMEWDSQMRTWRAVGDAAFMLLFLTLTIGSLAKIWPKTFAVFLTWRRALGIWFALFALVHSLLIWNGWARWSVQRLLGYQELAISGLAGQPILIDPGFGLANLMGLVALFWGLVLFAVSSDTVIKMLGVTAWKHIQNYVNLILYLVVLHVAYYLFLHYELHLRNIFFQRAVPNPNWFQFWFLGLVVVLLLLQTTSFVVSVRRRIEPHQ